ncbi:MAG: heme-copper oxidase subunit III [Nitrospirae bacterium]|nr:heme-copper oxidase subunit III [Nitrospirota bacterium]
MAQSSAVQFDAEHHDVGLSVWPFTVGMAVLLVMLGFMSAFQWKLPMVGMFVGGAGVVGILIGLFGWISQVYAHKFEAGLSKVAIIIFILSEAALFGGLFSGYLYNMFPAPVWPPANTPAGVPPLGLALILSVVLLSSSATMQVAENRLEKGDIGGFKLWLSVTMVLGLLFLAGQASEWTKLIGEGFTVSTNAYGTFFYTVTGFHGSHVLVGFVLMLFILLLALGNKINKQRQTVVKACGYYWHFVDGIWLLVLSLIYVLPYRNF